MSRAPPIHKQREQLPSPPVSPSPRARAAPITPNRSHHLKTTREDKQAASKPQNDNMNRSNHCSTETATSPPSYAQARQSSRIPTRTNNDYSRSSGSEEVPREPDEQVIIVDQYDPSMNDQSLRTVSPVSLQSYYELQWKRGRNFQGTVTNITGSDISSFSRSGLSVDEYLKIHRGMMKNMGDNGAGYDANATAEGGGDIYNIAGVGGR
ncbi:hypothetical protein BDQ17DRAFT_1433870 [Cyathus striatus]|nr:hypothetical protein BDQ17DRAFT_1433870 [Cyathus striatus]